MAGIGTERKPLPSGRMWDDAAWWEREIHRGEERRREVARRQSWDKLDQLLDDAGMDMTLVKESNEQAQEFERTAFVNWPLAFASIFVPAVYWRQPRINVNAVRPAELVGAKLVQPAINSAMKRTRFRTHLRRAIWDALKYGHGWIKVGWFTRFGEVPTGSVRSERDIGQSKISDEIYLMANAPYTYRINPRRMVVDPDATCYEEARWLAQESIVDIDSVRTDPYLKHRDDITPLVWGPAEDDDATLTVWDGRDDQPTGGLWARYWEIWDREHNVVRILCQGSKDFNRTVEPWPWSGLYGFPYKFLALTDSSQGFYPTSPLVMQIPLVEEQSFIRTMRMEGLRKQTKKFIVSEGAFSEEQLKLFADPECDIVKCSGLPRDAIQEVTGLQPDPNLYMGEEKAEQNIRDTSGFSELLMGQVPYSRIAATTTSIMQQNTSIRFTDCAERVGEFIIDTAQDLFKVIRDFQEYPGMILAGSAAGTPGGPDQKFIQYQKTEIEGDFYFSLDIEELSVSSKQQRIKESVDLATIGSNFKDAKARSLWRDVLIAYGKTDIDDYCNPESGPPLDPAFENTLLAQGIPVPPNPKEDFELHLRIHADMIQSPEFAQIVRQNPSVGTVTTEHIQQTNAMAQAAAQLGPAAMGGGGGGGGGGQGQGQGQGQTPSQQEGPAGPQNQPPGGPTNGGRGGGARAMAQGMMPGGPTG